MATLFNQRPSDVALLDESVGPIGRFYFDRGIASFGQAVKVRVEKAGTASNPAIAKTQRMREWERLMGGDMTNSTTGFADPLDAPSPRSRVKGRPDDDAAELAVEGEDW
ncbi:MULTISPECIES: hypothetical protein [Mycobacterium avium complex (MAC)]|uniref:Uncharacterized protein n=1 Tax=Mycobacterium timonense TaxID=701043 RepID=A0ABX3TSH7_9MYCO|nr:MULTISPECIES: hypothetical protein [Mycobacterium avium complex (MAC)]ETB35630.1 hypothetical protein N602_26205 [Mycobacterium avium subsp. hominissuis 10-5606]MBZ4500189.1 hypothetical protein [Mycobacterium avium subsp. hominissuis]MBZ4547746.1 hypothetical protein [Mycobacterium avium subsp. hominissuis]MBZ4600369.1 hypothetical protein [Mycobacterium avium subsp. hominissuis]MDO2381976.1 hypothetical protein [Mycobacterium avium subsp. hominissuis]